MGLRHSVAFSPIGWKLQYFKQLCQSKRCSCSTKCIYPLRRLNLLDKEEEIPLYLGLVDIIYAYAYNHRTTEGENTVRNYFVNKLMQSFSYTSMARVRGDNLHRARESQIAGKFRK